MRATTRRTIKNGNVLACDRGKVYNKTFHGSANSAETEDGEQNDDQAEQEDQPQAGEPNKQRIGKMSAEELMNAADTLTHAEYMRYKRLQSEKFDSEQY